MAKFDLKERFCAVPFRRLEVTPHPENMVHVCCTTWLSQAIGRLGTTNSGLREIWNSPEAQAIRESIHDGSYRFCNPERCARIQTQDLPLKSEVSDPTLQSYIQNQSTVIEEGPKILNLANDRSCNLSCPSCRTHKVLFKQGPEHEEISKTTEYLLKELLPSIERLQVCGSGDPIGSPVYREMLLNLDGRRHPDLKIEITTNGQMLTPAMWQRLERIHANISQLVFSVDAAEAATYRIVRRGGELQRVIENIRFLSEQKKQLSNLELFRMDFVVQQLNYREMADFVRLARSLGASSYFSKIISWNTYSESEFQKHAVWNSEHPEHADFLECLRDPLLQERDVDMGNLRDLQLQALDAFDSGSKVIAPNV